MRGQIAGTRVAALAAMCLGAQIAGAVQLSSHERQLVYKVMTETSGYS